MVRMGHVLAISVFLLVCFLIPFTAAAEHTKPAQEGADWARLTETQLAAFHSLSAKEQKDRAKQAAKIVAGVDQLHAAPERLIKWQQAVALNPAEPLHWLELAELCRWMGYRHAADDALASARSLFSETRGQHRKECIRRYSMTRGWLDYEAANWQDAEAWGAKAKEAGAGLEGTLLEMLGMAARPMLYDEYDLKCAVFLPFDNDSHNRFSKAKWAIRLYYHLHKTPFDEVLFQNCPGRKTRIDRNNVLRWRDYGLICEAHDKDDWSVCYYRKSFAALKGQSGGWLVEHEGGIPGYKPTHTPQPFWTNRDGYYVTGSLPAYAEYALTMMNDASQAARRTFWAEQLLYTATACTHRYPDWPWVYLWRGAAYLALDKPSDAHGELLTGREQFEFTRRPIDPRFDPLEGHILLLQKKYTRAKPLLERGSNSFPKDPRCWSDLGIIRAAEGDLSGARHAFDMALSLDRSLAVVWHNRGFLSLKEGDWETALVDLQTAADLAPHDEQLIHDLQRVKEKVQRDRSARK